MDLFFFFLVLVFIALGTYCAFHNDRGLSVMFSALTHYLFERLADRVDTGVPATTYYNPQMYLDTLWWLSFMAVAMTVVLGLILSVEVTALKIKLRKLKKETAE